MLYGKDDGIVAPMTMYKTPFQQTGKTESPAGLTKVSHHDIYILKKKKTVIGQYAKQLWVTSRI